MGKTLNLDQKLKKEYFSMIEREWYGLLHEKLDGNISGADSKSNIIINCLWSWITSIYGKRVREEERKRILHQLKPNVGMLRQWLNERPGSNLPLLTNEDLTVFIFFGLSPTQKKGGK